MAMDRVAVDQISHVTLGGTPQNGVVSCGFPPYHHDPATKGPSGGFYVGGWEGTAYIVK